MKEPCITWTLDDSRREWRAEWRGFKLRVYLNVNVGAMYEGLINGGRVVRARTPRNAKKKVGLEAGKRWKAENDARIVAVTVQ